MRTKLSHARTRKGQADCHRNCQKFAGHDGNLLGRFKNGSASRSHPQLRIQRGVTSWSQEFEVKSQELAIRDPGTVSTGRETRAPNHRSRDSYYFVPSESLGGAGVFVSF